MADFKDVVKQLEKNKVSQDAGFSAIETALGADTLAKSALEENTKNEIKLKNKELTYLQNLGNEVGLLNKNFKDLTKELKTPDGIIGGLLGLLISPFAIIFGFFSGVIKEFVRLQKLFTGPQAGWVTAVENFFKSIKKGFQFPKLPKNKFQLPKTFGEKLGNFFRSIITTISKPFEKLGKSPMLTGFIKTVKDTIAVVEKAFGKTGFIKGVFDTILKVFNIVVSSSSILGQIFGRLLKGLLIPFLAIKEMMKEDRGIGAKIVKGIGSVVENAINIFVLGIPELLKMLLSWVAGKLGFKSIEKFLDKISFTAIFSSIVRTGEELLIALGQFFSGNLTPSELLKRVKGLFGEGSELDKMGGKIVEAFSALYDDIVKSIKGVAKDAMKFIKDLFKFEEGSTGSLIQKFFGDAVDKLSNVFGNIIDSLISFARKILPESAQKLLGIEQTEKEKQLEQDKETRKKIAKIQEEISINQMQLNKSLSGQDAYGFLTNDTQGQKGNQTRIDRAQKKIDELNLTLSASKESDFPKLTVSDDGSMIVSKSPAPVIVAKPNESRANELNNNNGVSKSGVNVNNFNDFGDRSSKITNEGDKHISVGSIEQRDGVIKFGLGSSGM